MAERVMYPEKGPEQKVMAERGMWKSKPMPRKLRMKIPVGLAIEESLMREIRMGALPYAMEDKWYIYYLHNRLYFHRSWTGICAYIGYFKEAADGAVLTAIDVDPTLELTSDDPERELRQFLNIVNVVLLGGGLLGSAEYDIDPIALWSLLGRAYFKE